MNKSHKLRHTIGTELRSGREGNFVFGVSGGNPVTIWRKDKQAAQV